MYNDLFILFCFYLELFKRRNADNLDKIWILAYVLEPSCCKKRLKKSRARNWFGNKGRLKVLNETKLILMFLKEAGLAEAGLAEADPGMY